MSVRRGRTSSRTPRAQSTVVMSTPQSEVHCSTRKLRSNSEAQEIFTKNSKSVGFARKRSTKKKTRKNGAETKLSGEWEEQVIENRDVAEQAIEETTENEQSTANTEQQTDDAIEAPFQLFQHKELIKKPEDVIKQTVDAITNKTPERRLTFELDNSINSVDVLKRDSEQFSILEKGVNSVKSGVIKKKKPSKICNLRKKVDVLLERKNSTTALLDDSLTKNNKETKNVSVIVISSDSSAENSPVKSVIKDKSKNKIDLLRHTLTKKYNAKFLEVSKPNSSFRRDMPNFALLHKKEFDRMEDIASMSKRKEERAKILLSGSKPTALTTRNKIDSPLIKKSLFHVNNTPAQTNKFSTPPRRVHFTPETDESDLPHMALRKTPKPQVEVKKERRKTKDGYTRYGFKKIVASEKENKVAQVVAVANKSKATVPMNKEVKRELLKGVRSNRRFELLMAMRKGKA